MKTPKKSAIFGDKPPVPTSGGYILNPSGFKQPIRAFLHFDNRLLKPFCKLLKRQGFICASQFIFNLGGYVFRFLLRYMDSGVIHAHKNKADDLGLSNTKKTVK
jgi:hypothetical protein